MNECAGITNGPHEHWKDFLSSCPCWKDPLEEISSLRLELKSKEKQIKELINEFKGMVYVFRMEGERNFDRTANAIENFLSKYQPNEEKKD